jgi:LysR family cyn operon transcriptional activator
MQDWSDAMELRHLRSFLTLAHRRNFGKAAEALGISQPSLSMQIKQLEESLGAQLFVRDPAGLRLTTAGEQLRSRARRILRDVEDAADAIDPRRGAKPGVVHIGYSQIHQSHVIDAVQALLRLLPETRINCDELSPRRIEALLLEGRLDVGVAEAETVTKGIDRELLVEDALCLAVSLFHPYSVDKVGALERLEQLRAPLVLLRRGTPARRIVDRYFEMQSHAPKIVAETNTFGNVSQLIGNDFGTLASRRLTTARAWWYVDLPDAPVQSSYLLWRSPTVRSHAALAFAGLLRQTLDGKYLHGRPKYPDEGAGDAEMLREAVALGESASPGNPNRLTDRN